MPKSLTERFWSAIGNADGCWLWTHLSTNGYGYGQIWSNGYNRLLLAHRVSWELHHGPIPEGMSVLHHCDVPRCVNPAHLFLGHQIDNMNDMRRKKRGHDGYRVKPDNGVKNVNAKLTDADIPVIRSRRANGESLGRIAKDYRVWKQTIHQVVTRSPWKHVL